MKNIALALSGGGYRAAAFSLGTLSYLNFASYDTRKLLQNVKFISSASGGSITNIAYSVGVCKGQSFSTIYKNLMQAIEGEHLIKRVFELLGHDAVWLLRPDKSRNLINAFSLAYDELLYPDDYFKLYTEKLHLTDLEEICVNATEVANGLSFRFQSQHATLNSGEVGNGYINFTDKKAAGELKLADILACSSCFPGGFEPFIFPGDFTHEGLEKQQLTDGICFDTNPFSNNDNPDEIFENEKFKKGEKYFGIMDGGIADNQAVDSILLAIKRRKNREAFDLLLITDVTSYLMDSYSLPMESGGLTRKVSVSSFQRLLLITGLLFPIIIVASLFIGWHTLMYLLFIPTLASLLAFLYIRFKIASTRLAANRNRSTWNLMLLEYSGYFLKLRLSALVQMLASRLKSVLLITSDVYLRQIRSHYYRLLYSDTSLRNIVVSNAIYDLSRVNRKGNNEGERVEKELGYRASEGAGKGVPTRPSDPLIAVAEKARLMATTLWFDKYQVRNQSKAAVVATGQFTTCYNLLKYMLKKEKKAKAADIPGAEGNPAEPVDPWTEKDDDLKAQLENDWAAFNQDPFWLYNKESEADAGFVPLTAKPKERDFIISPK